MPSLFAIAVVLTFSFRRAEQEVYYATHGFFLSTRAIYLLIFNLLESEEESQIEYWLQSIGSRTGSATHSSSLPSLWDSMCSLSSSLQRMPR
jgi:hypothetical protein